MVGDDDGSCWNGTGKQRVGSDIAVGKIFVERLLYRFSNDPDVRRSDGLFAQG